MTIHSSLRLTSNDYKKILSFYKRPIPNSSGKLKKEAENMLRNKLCRCIRKFDNTPKGIGICTRTIINNKGYTRGKFNCHKKRNITLKKRYKL